MNTYNRILALISILLCQLPMLAAQPHHVFHLDRQDGLSSRYIRNIAQDARGFIWVATSDGLNRFDGNRFETFNTENSGLPSNQVNDIIQDPVNRNRLLISTRNDGLATYDYKTGKILKAGGISHSPDIPGLSLSADGKHIWITNYHFVPDLYDPATGKSVRLFETVPEGMPRGFWTTRESPDGKRLYLGHDGNGFTVVDLKSKKFVNFRHSDDDPASLLGNHVYTIYPDIDGRVWLGTDKGVSIFNSLDGTFANILPSDAEGGLLPGSVWSIRQMSDGDLWFATSRGGVSILRAADRLRYPLVFGRLTHSTNIFPRHNLSSSSIFCIFEDSFGNKWIGNETNGIDVVSHTLPFFILEQPFPQSQFSRPKQAVWSTAFDKEGCLWIGGEDQIMQMGDFFPKTYTLPTKNAGYNALVKAVRCDRTGRIWVGTNNSGLFILDPASGVFSSFKLEERDIRDFVEDTDGSMLIATKSGVYRASGNSQASPDEKINGLLFWDRNLTCLLRDAGGNLWVGSFGQGLAGMRRDGTQVNIDRDHGLPSNTVNAVFEDDNNRIWVATREGVAMLNTAMNAVEKTLTAKDGLINSNVKSLLQDGRGNIWMATNQGMACFNTIDETLSVYQRAFGSDLPTMTENSGSANGVRQLIFGTLNGLLQLNVDPTDRYIAPAKIVLSGLKAHDKTGDDHNLELSLPIESDRVTLPYNLNTFTLTFADLDITHSANADFSYNMEGVNEVWTPVLYDNEAVYRDLKPGHYTFRVRCRLNGGEWSEPEALLYLDITPPLWLTWWAKLLYVLGAIIGFAFLIIFYKHKLDLEQKLAIEKENSKNSNTLNEERLVFFTNITHELRTPLSLIVGPIEDLVNDEKLNSSQRKKLLTIRASSMRLLNLINGILEFRKTETRNRKLEVVHGNLSNYVREIGLRFKELNNKQNVQICIDMPENDEIHAYYDPEVISTVVNNLMGNAIKYTREGSITLSIKTKEERGVEYVCLSVADTGQGIPAADLPHIFERYYQAHHNKKISGTGIGLALTKNLVDLHEGEISVESTPGEGSTFTVRLVLKNNYPAAKHREVEPNDLPDTEPVPDEPELEAGISLLIVEDDPDVREYIVQSFGDEFTVFTAANGKEGLDMVRKHIPDIVVSDIMMPEMDGIELCGAIKSDFATSHIPVILLTAKDSLLDKEEGYARGADSYLTKPFSANLLKARINNILEARHQLTIRLLASKNETESLPAQPASQEPREISEQSETSEAAFTTLDREFIDKFKRVVDENLEVTDLDVPFIADRMCMSHSTLYRKIKGITGMTPNEFIRKLKLAKACELLASGSVSVSDISYATGFSSPAYFRRVFKAEFGLSPTQYLEKSKSPSID